MGSKIRSHKQSRCLRSDVRLKAQVETAVKKGIEHFGKLDVVVKYLPLHFAFSLFLVCLVFLCHMWQSLGSPLGH